MPIIAALIASDTDRQARGNTLEAALDCSGQTDSWPSMPTLNTDR